MNCTQEKYLRYEDWSSEASSSPLQQFSSKVKSMPTSASKFVQSRVTDHERYFEGCHLYPGYSKSYAHISNNKGNLSLLHFFSIERQYVCWEETCGEHQNFDANIFYCGFERHEDYSFLNSSCPLFQPDVTRESRDFDFGIYLDALQSHVVYKKKLFSKWSYSLWWGLRSLSSIGQSLDTSDFVLENLFAITVAITGLVLFSLLIGNMQKYLQSITSKVEEMRVRKQDTEQWMSHHMLPEHLRGRVRRYEQYKWQETRGVDEESLMNNLPSDLRTDIKRHLFWDLVKRVPMFEKMDDQLLDAMCDCLKPVLYTEGSLIYREGDPVDRMTPSQKAAQACIQASPKISLDEKIELY
ncbi:hypothetical protein Leryth_018977 [Lithospermum erythrorhizon]|nr:hypothetical protein Leryth_018977 [Lithospermum erythrorhizon]